MAHEIETQEQITAKIVAETAKATAQAVFEAAQAAAMLVAKENTSTAVAIAGLKVKLEMLEAQQNGFVVEMKKTLDDLFKKINEIIAGRPTYGILVIVTLLSCVCTGLIVAFMTKL